MRTLAVVALTALLALPALAATDATHAVRIQNSQYQPPVLQIDPGDTVVWTNVDPAPTQHSVTDVLGTFDSGLITGPFVFSHTFPNQGVVVYHCRQHPTMWGVIVVN